MMQLIYSNVAGLLVYNKANLIVTKKETLIGVDCSNRTSNHVEKPRSFSTT